MRRREFIGLLGGAVTAWPVKARGQPSDRIRLIGILLPIAKDDPDYQPWLTAFRQALQELGWVDGRNMRMDIHWATANHAEIRRRAIELLAFAPDVILAHGAATVGPLLQATRTVPIVFPIVADPVGAGFVASLARPGGNATGFMNLEYGMSGKWLELLKQIVPTLTRVAVLRDAGIPSGPAQFGVIQAIAPALRVEIIQINLRNSAEIEPAIADFASSSNGGLIIAASGLAYIHRDLIIRLAAERRLPAIYFDRSFVAAGGLASYGPDQVGQCRLAAGYVDRILKGEKPADIPVQAPTKYELVINLKTAKALALAVPPSVLAQANEVIE